MCRLDSRSKIVATETGEHLARTSSMTIKPGTQLGRYEVRSLLGAGGMGEVYLAHDTQLNRAVALKVLPADLASNQERMRRFVQEAQSAAALNHPAIAHIYEIGQSNGLHFIAMEYIEGETLREKIYQQQSELKRLLKYLQQVAEGLVKAHAAGIVHRDLKPDNIMITRDGYAKILDFGLAKLIEPNRPNASANDDLSQAATAVLQQHSQPGMVMGTVGYMSPEQAQGKVREIDHRSDIFSFGCILFEAATRQRTFTGDSTIQTLHKIIYEPAPPIKDFNPSAPPDLQRIVRRCLAKDPEDRYQTIKDVAIELRDLRREMESAEGLDISVTPSSSSDAVASGSAVQTGSQSQALSLGEQPTIRIDAHSTETVNPVTSQATAIQTAHLTQVNRRRRRIIFAIAALVVAGLSIGFYALFKSNRPAPFSKLKISRVTSTGKASDGAISPDGRYIVHVVDDGGRQSLELRQVATNTNQEIIAPAEVSYYDLAFSPDGNYIYYVMREKNNAVASLYRKPVLGGEGVKLITNIDSRVSLSPDGKRMAFVRDNVSQGEDSVMVANADGTGEQKIASRKAPDFYNALAWSPDGKLIALSTGTFKGNFHGSVVTVPVTGGDEKPVTSQT